MVDKLAGFDDKYDELPGWVEAAAELRTELDAAVKELKSKLSLRSLDDDVREAKGVLRNVTKHLTASDPAWWRTGLENADAVVDKLAELDDKHSETPAWQAAATDIRQELAAATKELRKKLAVRAQADDKRECESKVSSVRAQLKQGDPAWWHKVRCVSSFACSVDGGVSLLVGWPVVDVVQFCLV